MVGVTSTGATGREALESGGAGAGVRAAPGGDGPAHVEYVTDGPGEVHDAVEFLASVVSDPVNAALLAAGALGAVGAVVVFLRLRPALRDVTVLQRTLAEYEDLVPWMLRLSLGLPLVGAGFAGYLFTPAVPVAARVPLVAIGFLLLFGLATRFVAAAGLAVYLAGLAYDPALLLAWEYVGGFLALVLLGSGRPSADHLLGRVASTEGTVYGQVDPVHRVAVWFADRVEPYERYAPTVVRVGLGATFAYLGVVEKLAAPGRGLAVVEKYGLSALVPVDPGLWVVGAGLVELAVGAALIFGFLTRGVAAVAFLVLTTTLFGLPDDPVLAHVTLFGLTSVVFTTGSGPLALDGLLRAWTGAGARAGRSVGSD